MRLPLAVCLLAALTTIVDVRAARGSNVRADLRRGPPLVGLGFPPNSTLSGYEAAMDALVDVIARAPAVPATSGAFTYRYDPDADTYVRTSDHPHSALFVEHPQTLGRGAWNVGLTF